MVCYYENWAQYRKREQEMMPSEIDPFLCTHVLYAFAKVEDGELAPYEWNDFGMTHDMVGTNYLSCPCVSCIQCCL